MENNEITRLKPSAVWRYFYEITRVPRPSRKEGKILEYLRDFAREHGLEWRQDDIGNLVVVRPASPGKEGLPTVILQSHVDMVCEKNGDKAFDFDEEPIEPHIEGGWVKADGTTLGADCGIGMAAELAVLADSDLSLPRIEGLFTVDEETGLTGASNIAPDLLTGRYLINLDSEDEGEIFIGCAGGIDTVGAFSYNMEPVRPGHVAVELRIAGLKGGHSGDDIDKSRANSNKLLGRFLYSALTHHVMDLHWIDGGNLRNAIPREARAVITVPGDQKDRLMADFRRFAEAVKEEYRVTEPDMVLSASDAESVTAVIDRRTADGLIHTLFICPNGVEAMSQSMPGMVETSTNLASVKMEDGHRVMVSTSQRSSLESKKACLSDVVRSVMETFGALVRTGDGYPGWEPRTDSRLLAVTEQAYRTLFHTDPKVRSIHAGLECGLFLRKYPQLEMVSFGPTIRGVHSPDERLEIGTVDKFYRLLVRVLEELR